MCICHPKHRSSKTLQRLPPKHAFFPRGPPPPIPSAVSMHLARFRRRTVSVGPGRGRKCWAESLRPWQPSARHPAPLPPLPDRSTRHETRPIARNVAGSTWGGRCPWLVGAWVKRARWMTKSKHLYTQICLCMLLYVHVLWYMDVHGHDCLIMVLKQYHGSETVCHCLLEITRYHYFGSL